MNKKQLDKLLKINNKLRTIATNTSLKAVGMSEVAPMLNSVNKRMDKILYKARKKVLITKVKKRKHYNQKPKSFWEW
jgi:hypothetical protein